MSRHLSLHLGYIRPFDSSFVHVTNQVRMDKVMFFPQFLSIALECCSSNLMASALQRSGSYHVKRFVLLHPLLEARMGHLQLEFIIAVIKELLQSQIIKGLVTLCNIFEQSSFLFRRNEGWMTFCLAGGAVQDFSPGQDHIPDM